jgi:outer membrane beta-barrel protein
MFSHSVNNKTSNKTSKSLVFAILAALLLSVPAHAQKKQETAQPQSPDKLDVTDLEKKYWAAKDTDFSVVQNRTYSKEGRFALTAQYGTLVNDAFSKGPMYNAALTYYFTERHGIELNYMPANLTDSKAVANYRNISGGVAPNHNKVTGYYGVTYNWVPIYAKVSLLNKKIVYFDMAISPGIGVVNYESQIDYFSEPNIKQSSTALSLDVTQTFFVSRHVALRFDYKNKWFKEKILKAATVNHGDQLETGTNNTTSLMFGLQLFY